MNRTTTTVLTTVLAAVAIAGTLMTGIAVLITRMMCGTATPTSLIAGIFTAAGSTTAISTRPGCTAPVTAIRGADIVLLVLLVAVTIAGGVLWHRWKESDAHLVRELRMRHGFAQATELRRHLSGKAMTKKATYLRPALLGRAAASDVGWKVGSSRGIDVYVSIEDSMLLIGGPRSGKGLMLVINAILDWAGPLITTSTRNDNLAATMAARATRGQVTVFDPQGLSGVKSTLKISPITGCEDPMVAEQRAAAIIGASSLGQSSSNQEWAAASRGILAQLLHAAALGHRTVTELAIWGENPAVASDAVKILETEGPPGWAGSLASIIGGDEKMLANQWFGLRGALAPLRIPQIAAAMNPTEEEVFDAAEFLSGENTLYLIGTGRGAGAAGPFLAALMDDIVEVARRKALSSQDSRLPLPLGLILDEIANIFAWPSLPTVMADGGGIGISPMVVLQARTQAETQWSHAEMQSVFSAATAKVMLGGSSDIAFLKDMESLLGQRDVTRRSRTYAEAGTSEQIGLEHQAVVTVGEMRRMPQRLGLLSYRGRRPILLDLHAWTDRRDAKHIRAGKAETEASQQAVFAEARSELPPERSGGTA
jgi:type IV secretion system protein VirD4